jgi:FkbM family methyltransferase
VLRYRMPDHTLYLDPSDDVIAARVLLRGDWQRRDLERVIALLKIHVPSARDRLFLDVGANIGSQTIYAMLSGYFSGAVAIEPEPHNFSLLQENLAANDLDTRVRAVNCAAGALAETKMLVRSPWNKGGHAIDAIGRFAGTPDTVTVNVMPLSAILQKAGISAKDIGLVWIDVNGTELSVLQGMSEILESRVPVVIEHLPPLIDATTAREVHRLLSLYYTSFCLIDAEKHTAAPVSEMDPLRDAGDFLFF